MVIKKKLPKYFCPNCRNYFETGKFDDNDSDIYDDVCPMCGCAPCELTESLVRVAKAN